jgi:hypothetical protein
LFSNTEFSDLLITLYLSIKTGKGTGTLCITTLEAPGPELPPIVVVFPLVGTFDTNPVVVDKVLGDVADGVSTSEF